MVLNSKEEHIIGEFMANLDCYHNELMTLLWENKGEIVAEFYTCFEDANDFDLEDDEKFEEHLSFMFIAREVVGEPPVSIKDQKIFLINYHNFPDAIIADGKKIN